MSPIKNNPFGERFLSRSENPDDLWARLSSESENKPSKAGGKIGLASISMLFSTINIFKGEVNLEGSHKLTQLKPIQSGGGCILYVTRIDEGIRGREEAQKIKDSAGQLLASQVIADGAMGAIGAISSIAANGIDHITPATKASSRVLINTSKYLHLISSKLLIVRGTITFFTKLALIYQTVNFSRKLGAFDDIDEKMGHLVDQLELTEKERKAARTQAGGKESEGVSDEDSKLLSPEDRHFLLNKCADCEQLQIKEVLVRLKKGKISRLKRSIGAKGFEAIDTHMKKVRGQGGKTKESILNLSTEEKEKTIKAIKSSIISEQLRRFISVAVWGGIIGAVLIGTIFTGGGAPLVAATISAAIAFLPSVVFFIMDLYSILTLFKQGSMEKKDKVILALITSFISASIAVSSIFSGGIIPSIAALFMVTMSVAVYGYSYFQRTAPRQEGSQNREPIELLNMVQSGVSDGRLNMVQGALPNEDVA